MIKRFCDRCRAEILDSYYSNVRLDYNKSDKMNFYTQGPFGADERITCTQCFNEVFARVEDWKNKVK